MIDGFLITCEHGGNVVPARYRALFRGRRALLDAHQGFDCGALAMAAALARALRAPLVSSTTTRLLIDLNRSLGHRQLFSIATRDTPAAVRSAIVEQHYRPYRLRVEGLVSQASERGQRVIHISSHSFTPEMNGIMRRADVGLLYDPARRGEAQLCARWKAALASRVPGLRVRRNYPYSGSSDGLTSHLRRRYAAAAYVGIELEINQAIVQSAGARWAALRRELIDSLREACVA